MIETRQLSTYQTAFMGDQLIRTKLQIPPLPLKWVPRPELIRRLNADDGHKLTLVAGAAGFGKTTLLCEWASQTPLPVAWVNLDERDDQPEQFWLYLITALQLLHIGIGDTALELLYSQDAPAIEVVLTILINDIAQASEPVVLVLDNYHLIHTLSIHAAMTFLIDHLPRQLRIVIASRATPPLPLARLRSLGHLNELHTADLSFSPAEIACVIGLSSPPHVESPDVALIAQRSEGWITALRLSLNGHTTEPVTALTGTHRHLVDYFSEEVFDRQPPAIRDFLMRTSIVESLSGDLCDAITGGSHSRAILEQLERENCFTMSLDPSRQNYRYHALFAEFLRSRLQACCDPATIDQLHRRAADWYQANGMSAEAASHLVPTQEDDPQSRLSDRENEVLHLITQGLSNHQIADELVVAVSTVKTHVKSIYRKLDVRNRYEAIERVRDQALLPTPLPSIRNVHKSPRGERIYHPLYPPTGGR